MPYQLVWVIMFALGVALAWLILRAFGITCLVGLLALSLICSEAAEGGGGTFTFNVENRTPQQVEVSVYEDPDTAGSYEFQFFEVLDGGETGHYTMPSAGSLSGRGWLSGTYSSFDTPFFLQFPDGPRTNDLNVFAYVAPDGHAYWSGTGPMTGGTFVDTNAPMVATGEATNNTSLSGSNTYGGISFGYTNVANSRDAAGVAKLIGDAGIAGEQLNAYMTNNWPGQAITNAFNITGAGVDAEPSEWIVGGLGFADIDIDPHQWAPYNALAAWCKLGWMWLITIGWIYYISEELDKAIARGFMTPGNHSMSSIGGVIQGALTSVVFAACILALPLVLWAAYATLAVNDGAPGETVGGLFVDGPGYVQHKAAVGWNFANEWVPCEFCIVASGYWLFARFFLFRLAVNVQLMIIRLATVWLIFAGVQIVRSENEVVLAGPGYGVVVSDNDGGWCDYEVRAPWLTYAFTTGFGVPPVSVRVMDGVTNAACWLRDSNGVQIGFEALTFGSLTNGLVVVGGAGVSASRASSDPDVDGLQAFIEGFGFGLIGLGTLAWVKRMRKWAMNPTRPLDI